MSEESNALAYLLQDCGWRSPNDAQWTQLEAAIPAIRELLSRPAPAVQVPDGMALVNREDLDYMLGAVQRVAEAAYHRAGLVCCRVGGPECCGSPEPEWTPEDQEIMEALSPVVTGMSAMLAAAAPATVATEAVAQGGGVDVAAVMTAIEKFGRAYCSYVRGGKHEDLEEANRIYDVIIPALLASPAVPVVDGWIAEVERLPDEDMLVLCYWEDSGKMDVCYQHNTFWQCFPPTMPEPDYWCALPPAPAIDKEPRTFRVSIDVDALKYQPAIAATKKDDRHEH